MGVFWIFLGIILILCTIVLLIFAVRQHQKVSSDKPFDDTNRQIDFDDFYNKLHKFVGNEQEKIYAVLGIKNATNLLIKGIQENGFCILTDKAVYFIGRVYQKKWIFAFRANVQHRIIASEMKGIKVGTLSHIWMLILAFLSITIEMAWYRWINMVFAMPDVESQIVLKGIIALFWIAFALGVLASIVIGFFLVIYFVLHAFFLKRTNICIEFTSLTVAFLASELGKQEIKDFYKAVSEVQELYVNIVNPVSVEHTVNEVRKSTGVNTNKVTSLSELSKLYENGMLTKEEFEHLKQEVIGSQ